MRLVTVQLWWASCQSAVRRRLRGEKGASLVEYALLLSLIAVICVAAITFIGETAKESFSSTGDSFGP